MECLERLGLPGRFLWRCGRFEFLVFVLLIAQLAVDQAQPQYRNDFTIYYYAAKSFADGHGPYDNAAMSAYLGYTLPFPYPYPPPTILFWAPFTLVDFQSARYLYALLQTLVVAAVVYIWVAFFLDDAADLTTYVYFFLGYNCSLVFQVVSGNVALIEQALLWAGFLFYIRGRLAAFCGFVLAAASFKVTPALFLVLLLFSNDPRRLRYLAASAAVLFAYLAAPFLAAPEYMGVYARSIGVWYSFPNEHGVIAPCNLALIRDIIGLSGIRGPGYLPLGVYSVVAASVAYVSLRAIRSMMRRGDVTRIVFFTCLVYALTALRFKDYQYPLLILPTLYILRSGNYARHYLPLLILFLAVVPYGKMLMGWWSILAYYPLFAAYGVWLLYVRDEYAGLDASAKGG